MTAHLATRLRKLRVIDRAYSGNDDVTFRCAKPLNSRMRIEH